MGLGVGSVGEYVGDVGIELGIRVGLLLGARVGILLGVCVGSDVGRSVGLLVGGVGDKVGIPVGIILGANVGSTVTFSIYDGAFSDASVIGDTNRIIASEDFDASTGHDTDVDNGDWVLASIDFNSGSNTTIVLFITNDFTLTTTDSETFLDDFSIEAN